MSSQNRKLVMLCPYTSFPNVQLGLNRGGGYSGPFPEIEPDGLNKFLVSPSDDFCCLLGRLRGGCCFTCAGAASFTEASDDRCTFGNVLVSPGSDVYPVHCQDVTSIFLEESNAVNQTSMLINSGSDFGNALALIDVILNRD